MSSVGDFATRSLRIEDTPRPFREALLHRVDEGENIRHLIHSPAFATGKFRSLASLLCVTDKRWLIVLCEKDGTITVGESTYDSILLVELTIILLSGQLKIDFVFKDEVRSTALQFNTVMKRDYLRAIQDVLTAIDGDKGEGEQGDLRNTPILRDWPLKFPINRLAKFQIHRVARFSLLELEGYRGDGGENLVFLLPRDKEEAVSRLLKSVSASAERVGDDRGDPRR